MSLVITPTISIPDEEISISQIRAHGPGGQNVNKVASAIHLRFSIPDSSLPPELKERLLMRSDQRITARGEIVIKASRFRTREQNLEDGLRRLAELVRSCTGQRKKRRPTKPSLKARKKRMDAKTRRGRTKQLRRKVETE